jgi:cytochrome c peroxidase
MKTNKTFRLTLALMAACVFFISSASIAADGLSPKESLGKALFFNKISSPDWVSCSTCHDPDMGFTGPIGGINKHGAVYRGADPHRFGNRKPPSAAYATLSPVFHFDTGEGTFVGGNFWNGRATGERLGNPAADQALGPFLNPVEQNNSGKQAVLEQIADSKYADLWEEVWGEPISYETDSDIDKNYDRVGLAIAEYEASNEVNQFSSKYDYYLAGEVELTEQEAWGLELFNDPEKGNCAACHPSEPSGDEPPLFTDFTFDNLGVPRNPDNPFYDMDEVYLDDGSPINPLGSAWIDEGLGGFLSTRPEWAGMAAENMGKQKVPTLRNVDKRPGNNTPKAFTHNGFFKSLEEVVHFYNTRDVEDWPEPEVSENVNKDELGNLGLTKEEEAAIVAFLRTLSDGYIPAKEKDKDVEEVEKDRDDKIVEQDQQEEFVVEWDEPQPQKSDEKIEKDFDKRIDTEEAFAFAIFETAWIIDELGPENFKNEESALKLQFELDTVLKLLDEGMYIEAQMLLQTDILERVNGCVYSGQPDPDDWITSFEGQLLVYPILLDASELLESLIR